MLFIVVGRRSGGENPQPEGEYPLRLISKPRSENDPELIMGWSDIQQVKKKEDHVHHFSSPEEAETAAAKTIAFLQASSLRTVEIEFRAVRQ